MLLRKGLLVLRLFLVFFLVLRMLLGLTRLLLVITIRGAARQSAFAASFRGKLAVLRKAAAFGGNGFAALAASTRSELRVL